jgi:pimeloyl-ACP methyl ester carboxylesterase
LNRRLVPPLGDRVVPGVGDVPDMPGYGYSDRPTGPPPDAIAVAGLWAELMGVLGYARFGAAGGDIGSHVSRYLALDHPDRVVAVHAPRRAWLERTANVVRVTEPARAGHFAPFEEPELYAEELRAFFRPYRAAATEWRAVPRVE